MSDSGSFDDELRRMARRSTEETASATNVDAELEAVHDRIAGRTAIVTTPRGPDRRLMWLSAAAATVLVAGVVAAVATRDRGETLQSATEVTTPGVATTTVATVVPAVSTTSLPLEVTTTSLLDTTTTSPPTTLADEAAPPPATTAAPLAEPTTTTTTVPVNECWREPVPPPSLADGSPVGEPVVVDADKGLGTETYRWGEGDFAITQIVGVEPDPIDAVVPDDWTASSSGTWVGVADPPAGSAPAHTIRIADRSSGCTHAYRVSGELIDWFGAAVIAGAWVEYLGEEIPIPDGRHDELKSPVPYLAWTAVSGPATQGWPDYELRSFGVDGTDLGPVELSELERQRVTYPVDIGSGRRMGLLGGPQYEPCPGTEPIALGADGPVAVDQRLLDSSVSSIAGAPTGFVVVSRGMCPPGTVWGDPGTSVELVRFHVDDPAIEPLVFARIEPGEGVDGFASGRWRVSTVDPDGRYVGAEGSTSVESQEFFLLDMLADADSSGEPIDLPTGCRRDDSRLAAPPQFVGGGITVLARSCGPDLQLVIDVVSLGDRSLLWSQVVDGGTAENYGLGLSGLSGLLVDGEVWVLVSSGDRAAGTIDLRIRTVLLSPESQIEITSLRPTIDYTFAID